MTFDDHIKHAIAGCTAGLSTVLALQPLDVIKTRLQVQDGGAGVIPVYKGTIDAVGHICRDEGWRALYSGLTPALIGSGMAWGIYFFTYNHAKARYQKNNGTATRLSPAMHLISAAEAGAVVCFATNPVWVVKTRLQLQFKTVQQAAISTAAAATSKVSVPVYNGFWDCLTQIARQEGFRGLYKGLLPSLLLVSHGAIQFAVYEELKEVASNISSYITPLDNGDSSSKKKKKKRVLTHAEITAFGALSKLAASTATYPSQVIRSRLQQRMDPSALKYTGVVDVVRKTMAREGIKGFYKGLVPNVLRVMPQSAITFLVYESVMRELNKLSDRQQQRKHSVNK